MKTKSKGISLNYLSNYYDLITPAEKSRFRQEQIKLAKPKEGEKALDVGCGTGPLSILAKLAVGETGRVAGIDIATKMISQCKKKIQRNNLDIDFQVASIDSIPFPDKEFDMVLSSMMFHHLPLEIKKTGLKEIIRVLKEEGRFFLCDFCAPHYITLPLMYLMFIWIRSTRYQLFGKLPQLMKETGFREVNLVKRGYFLDYYLSLK